MGFVPVFDPWLCLMKRLEKAQDRQSFRRVNPWALSALGAYLRIKLSVYLLFSMTLRFANLITPCASAHCVDVSIRQTVFYRALYVDVLHHSYLVDPASSHMLVSKIKPCMSKYKHPLYCETAYSSLYQQLFIWWSILTWITVVILELIHAYKSQCKLQMYLLDKESIPVLLVLLMNHNNCSNRTRKRR